MRVRQRFSELQVMDEEEKRVPWHVVDAAQSMDEVQAEINQIVQDTMQRVADGAPLNRMFQEGEYLLPSATEERN